MKPNYSYTLWDRKTQPPAMYLFSTISGKSTGVHEHVIQNADGSCDIVYDDGELGWHHDMSDLENFDVYVVTYNDIQDHVDEMALL